MTAKPSPKVEDEPGAEERFDQAIKNALAMKPAPRKPSKPAGERPDDLPRKQD